MSIDPEKAVAYYLKLREYRKAYYERNKEKLSRQKVAYLRARRILARQVLSQRQQAQQSQQ